jgi:arylsulfatase A-like enzyme
LKKENIMKKIDIVQAVTVGMTLAAPMTGLHAAEPAAKPNIIFILTDDQGYGDLGRHGHPSLETPNLDRLYDGSVRFDNFYVSPSCSPTRAALMTGMHEFKNGVTHTLEPREHLYKEAVILPQLLKTAGYKTGFIGKWHLSDRPGYEPSERGFDWCSSNKGGPREHFDPEMVRNGVRRKATGFREDLYFDEAMTFMDECGKNPFFIYLCTYSPHTPLGAPEELVAKYRAKGLNDKHATYLAMIDNIDMNVGRLESFLQQRGLADNTIIIFINDNGVTEGLDVYNAGMRGCKCTIWEGGTRAMSFWKWPGHWKPHTAGNLTAHLDVLPTLCDLAGVKIPETLRPELEGFSLVPLLNGGDWEHNDRLLYHNVGRWPSGLAKSHKHAMCAVRQGDFLLLRSTPCDDPECEKYQSQCTTLRAVQKGLKTTTYANGTAQMHWGTSPSDRWVLFDVIKDPACQNDMAAQHPELVSRLIASYDKWWDTTYPVMIARGGDEGDPGALGSYEEGKAIQRRSPKATSAPAEGKAIQRSSPKATGGTPAAGLDMFRRMDADGDQKVTRAEYVGLFMQTFAAKDSNQDGLLTEVEFTASAFKSADADKDGKLSATEFENLYSTQFDARDKNKDGVLTADEM